MSRLVRGLDAARVLQRPGQRIVHRRFLPADPFHEVDGCRGTATAPGRRRRWRPPGPRPPRCRAWCPSRRTCRRRSRPRRRRRRSAGRTLTAGSSLPSRPRDPEHTLPVRLLPADRPGGVAGARGRTPPAPASSSTLGSAISTRAGGGVAQLEARRGVHLDAAFEGGHAVAEPAVDGSLRRRSARPSAMPSALAAAGLRSSCGAAAPGGGAMPRTVTAVTSWASEQPAEADVQVLRKVPNVATGTSAAREWRRHGTGLVDARSAPGRPPGTWP